MVRTEAESWLLNMTWFWGIGKEGVSCRGDRAVCRSETVAWSEVGPCRNGAASCWRVREGWGLFAWIWEDREGDRLSWDAAKPIKPIYNTQLIIQISKRSVSKTIANYEKNLRGFFQCSLEVCYLNANRKNNTKNLIENHSYPLYFKQIYIIQYTAIIINERFHKKRSFIFRKGSVLIISCFIFKFNFIDV